VFGVEHLGPFGRDLKRRDAVIVTERLLSGVIRLKLEVATRVSRDHVGENPQATDGTEAYRTNPHQVRENPYFFLFRLRLNIASSESNLQLIVLLLQPIQIGDHCF
jgi:hypothetical protein